MKLCSDCRKTPWPYLIVVFVASFAAFLTWLTLASTGISPDENRWWTIAVFTAVAVVVLSYMLSCMRRHCGHSGRDHAHGV